MAERLRATGERYWRSAGQVAIRWALDEPTVSCAIVGAKTGEHVSCR